EGEELPKTFNIHRLKKPTVITYAAHPEGIDQVAERARARGVDLGAVQDLSRRTSDGTELQWQRTQPPLPRHYGLPFLIDWGTTPQPGLTELPAIELLSFERIEVKPEPLQKATAAPGLGDGLATVREGRGSRFVLRLRTEDGREIELCGRAARTAARAAPAGPEAPAGRPASAGRRRRRAARRPAATPPPGPPGPACDS